MKRSKSEKNNTPDEISKLFITPNEIRNSIRKKDYDPQISSDTYFVLLKGA
jgi:hypothetical protein